MTMGKKTSAESLSDDSLPSLSSVLGRVSAEAAKRLVVLSGLKSSVTQADIDKLAGNPKKVRQIHFPLALDTNKLKCCAAILYRGKRDAPTAVSRLNLQKFQGVKLTASLYGENLKPTKSINLKRGRLIVRNLSFKCDVNSLTQQFSRFGEVTEVLIPLRVDGKKRGFGIVQFKSAANAAEAIKQMNGTTVLGRPIAVDWMLAKDRYEKAIEEEEAGIDSTDKNNDSVQDDESDDEDDNDNSQVNSVEDDEDEDDAIDSSQGDSDEDDDSNEDSDYSEDEINNEKKKTKKLFQKTDVDEGRTVFIRNLSFDSAEEDLEEFMSKFGAVAYCRVVVDPETEHPKGTAFVKFKSAESAAKCIAAAEDASGENDGLVLAGRRLILSLAITREKVQEISTQKKTKEKVDQRNLHLIRESLIRPGTKEAEGLSKSDIAKRVKVEAITRQKLKNPSIFVSTTRLCVRNIPTSTDDFALKKLFLKAASNAKAKINECRIMRDLNRVGASKVGKSRGFGFINFTDHVDALQALKNTNNNPEIFGDKKRLIVEFSLENRSALLAKEQRAERAMVKRNMFTSDKPVRFAPTTKIKVDTVPGAPPLKKGTLVLPSHSGAKVRHKKRTVQVDNTAKTKNITDVIKEPNKKKRKTGNRRKNVEVTDEVDQLVAKYRQKISATSGSDKWTSW